MYHIVYYKFLTTMVLTPSQGWKFKGKDHEKLFHKPAPLAPQN